MTCCGCCGKIRNDGPCAERAAAFRAGELTEAAKHCDCCARAERAEAERDRLREALSSIAAVIVMTHLDMGGKHRYALSNPVRTREAVAKVYAALADSR